MFQRKNVVVFLTVIFLGANIMSPIYAADNTSKPTNFFTNLINYISEKFGLNKTQVKTAVQEFKQDNQKQMQQNKQNRGKTRLDELVKQGKITQDQENAIINELTALKTAKQSNLTQEERQKQRQAEQDELKAWATANGIDYSLIMFNFGLNKPSGDPRPTGEMPRGERGGRGGRGGFQQ